MDDQQIRDMIVQLIDDLRDPNWQVRYHAADRLKVIGDERAVQPLVDVLADNNLTVRFIAAMTLGIIRDERAIEPLTQMLYVNDDPDVLWGATWALTEIGEASTMALIQVLAWGNAIARDAACDVLAKLGDEQVIVPLAWALCERGPRDYEVTRRFAAADALEQYGEASVSMLEIAVNHANSQVRARAARALGTIGSEDGIRPLVRLLDDHALTISGERVSQEAIEALRRIGTLEALIYLLD